MRLEKMDNITKWLINVSESETTKTVYTSRINAFKEYVKTNHKLDVIELKQLWREAKYNGIRAREKFLDYLADIIEDYTVSLKQKYAPTTIHSNLSVIQSYLHKGCRIKEVDVQLPKHMFITYHNRDITKEEIRKISEHSPLRARLFFLMMVESGLRPRTLTQLRYKHIKIDYEAERTPMKIELPSSLLKDRISDRFTFIGEDGFKLLREYLSVRSNIDDDDLIFQPTVEARMKKNSLSPETFSNKFSKLVLKLGLVKQKDGKPKALRLYCLRKYFANNMDCDSMYRNFWFCHKSVNDHYISRDVERHRQEYAKGYPHLRIYKPSGVTKIIEQQTQEIEDLKKYYGNEIASIGNKVASMGNEIASLKQGLAEIKKILTSET